MSIADNLVDIHARIEAACENAGRSFSSVRLVAVSKTKSVGMVAEALAAGQSVFGENYVQEALGKVDQLPKAEWHLIGTLQTNKVKSIAGRFSLIHSIDRSRLARELAKACSAAGVVQDILVQVHIGSEVTKSGFAPDEISGALEELAQLKSLRIRGLMTMPPLTDLEHEARKNFAAVRNLFSKHSAQMGPQFTELSMGTTGDFEWAIMEGATLVRVGQAIFGAREKST